VHVQSVLVLNSQRQRGQERQLRRIELVAGPVDGRAGLLVHLFGRSLDHGLVVIALHGERAVLDHTVHGIDRPAGFGPITHEVAEQHRLVEAELAQPRQAGGRSLAVGVQVGKQGKAHG